MSDDLKLTTGDAQFLRASGVDTGETPILPAWQGYAAVMEQHGLLIRYIQSDKVELAILKAQLMQRDNTIAELRAENRAVWIWMILLSVLVGAFLWNLIWRLA